MRITSLGAVNRAFYYDRNPLKVIGTFTSTIGPSGSTNRITYTVPTGRKAFMESVIHFLQVVTVSAPTGFMVAVMTYGINADGNFAPQTIVLPNGTVSAQDRVVITSGAVMLAGDSLKLDSQYTGTGGTGTYNCQHILTEFDA